MVMSTLQLAWPLLLTESLSVCLFTPIHLPLVDPLACIFGEEPVVDLKTAPLLPLARA